MEKIIKFVWFVVIGSFFTTTVVTISGLVYIWFINPGVELPFMKELFSALILETLAISFLLIKNSIDFLPKVKVYKDAKQVNNFLSEFASRGSSVEFVTNSASWLKSDIELQKKLISKAKEKGKITVFSAEKIEDESLNNSKINLIHFTNENYIPKARFTLINSSRQGAEELAIAIGSFPKHKVYIFTGQNSPYIIGMAKDIINLLNIVGVEQDV